MNLKHQKTDNLEGARNKTGFSGFTFKRVIGDKYVNKIAEVERVKYGAVKDEVKDSATLSVINPEGSKDIPVMFNRYNFKKIIRSHGYFNSADIVVTANEYDEGVFIKGTEEKPDKVNLVKKTDSGCFVIGANRFNGYGVVTFFEQYNKAEAKQYLDSLRSRGVAFELWEDGSTLHPSISRGTTDARDRVPASLSGVRADKK
ncbi:MAG: hypothetical protein NTZ38_01250 [Candidatus Taylorbacteria bacterium]|nr:hypothetical protein [Candidatus Taylorbacteria bacterium]